MMKGNFDAAFSHVVDLEGGYSNDPHDPGGETKFGISKRSYPKEDIATLTIQRAKEIYLSDYWNKCRCDELPYPLDYYVLDAAVNQGVSKAIKMLQEVVGVKQDGIIGLVTIKAAHTRHDTAHLYMAERAVRYFATENFYLFGKGWLKRIFKLAREA